MNSALRTLLLALLLPAAGCAGARYTVTADAARYPISFSPALPDSDGETLLLGEELQEVGTFSFTRTPVGFLYGATSSTLDISEEVNRRVEAAGGEGVVALEIATQNCATQYLFPLTLLPFYPGCQNVKLTGTVVSRARAPGLARDASLPAAAPPRAPAPRPPGDPGKKEDPR